MTITNNALVSLGAVTSLTNFDCLNASETNGPSAICKQNIAFTITLNAADDCGSASFSATYTLDLTMGCSSDVPAQYCPISAARNNNLAHLPLVVETTSVCPAVKFFVFFLHFHFFAINFNFNFLFSLSVKKKSCWVMLSVCLELCKIIPILR